MNVHTPEEDKQEQIADSDKSDQSLSAPATTTINTAGGSAITGTVNAGGDVIGRDRIEQHFHYHGTSQPATHNSPSVTPRGIFGQYPFNQHFFGRDDELTELHTLLQTEKQVSICPVITGMGGLGKTQLAAHYARRHTADYPDGIFWVTAADLNAIRGQLADFCVALGLPVADPQRSGDLSEQKISAFKHYLNDHSNTLLIFDNVDEPDYLRTRQIGAGVTALTLGGKLIITTRRRKLSGERFVELALQRLLPLPARQVLLTARPDLAADSDLDRLCEQFGYLPLMLNLAAAALKKRGGAIVGYLQRLQKLGAEKLHGEVAKVSLDDYHKSLTAVLDEQWSMLVDENARLLFRVAGQLPEAAAIPNARLGLLAGLSDVDEWERPLSDALEELERASVVERVDEKTTRLHPLVRDFADGLTQPEQRNDFRCQCAQHLADVYANDQTDMQRLGMEYTARGIAEILLDLITALALAQADSANHQSLIVKLQARLRHLRLEAHHLQGAPTTWRSERFWQQMLPRTRLTANQALTNQLGSLLQRSLHWLPHWGHQRQSLAIEQTLSGHKRSVRGMAILDVNRIVSASADHTLKVWNIHSGEVEQTLRGHEHYVNSVAVFDANRIVSASRDRTLKVWNLHSGEVEKTLRGHEGNVLSVELLDANCIVSTSEDRSIKVWNLHTGEVEQTLRGHEGSIYFVAVVDANRIVSASDNRTLKVWNLHNGTIMASIGLDGAPQCVAVVRQNDRTLVVAGDKAGALYCLELVEPKS